MLDHPVVTVRPIKTFAWNIPWAVAHGLYRTKWSVVNRVDWKWRTMSLNVKIAAWSIVRETARFEEMEVDELEISTYSCW